jgi:hypothetical protein
MDMYMLMHSAPLLSTDDALPGIIQWPFKPQWPIEATESDCNDGPDGQWMQLPDH